MKWQMIADMQPSVFRPHNVFLVCQAAAMVLKLADLCPVFTQGIRKGGILVHCYAGQSRSSALIMAYLIRGP